MMAFTSLMVVYKKERKVDSMAKFLEKGTKVKMKEDKAVVLASMFGNFNVGSVGELTGEHYDIDNADWYEVKFEDGKEIVPARWFYVIESDKTESDKAKVKLDKKTAEELSEITDEEFSEGDDVEIDQNE